MIPALLVPAGLFALAALAIPLLLHLARRTERRPTDFAALRWLRAKPRPRQRPRFEEWPLLVVRLLLLALLAVWLARPVALAGPDRRARVYVVPGVSAASAASFVKAGAEGHWLAAGFPPLDQPVPVQSASIVSLVREVDADLPAAAPVHILVPSIVEGADAELPRLSRSVDWRVVPGVMPRPVSRPRSAPTLAIRSGPGGEGRRYLAAVGVAWLAPGHTLDNAPLNAPLPPRGVALAWLGEGALPAPVAAWVEAGGTVLVPRGVDLGGMVATVAVVRDAGGAVLVEQVARGRGRVLRFVARLTPAATPALVEPDFPDRLRAAVAEPEPPPGRIAARDLTPVVVGAHVDAPALQLEWRPWLALAIAAALLVERWMATGRRRWSAP